MAFDASAACATYGGPCTADTIDADLDLHLFKKTDTGWTPSGALACASTTYDSTWEMCDIPVVAGEEYLIGVRKWSSTASYTYLGVAWSQYQVPVGAVCDTHSECASAKCFNGYCTNAPEPAETAGVTLDLRWTDLVTGPRSINDSVSFGLTNKTQTPLSFDLWVTAAGLDGRRVRRFLQTQTLAAQQSTTNYVPLSLAPIRSVGAASELLIEAQIKEAGVVTHTAHTLPLYYEADAAMANFTFYGDEGKSYNVDWTNGSFENWNTTIAAIGDQAASASGVYWDGAAFVAPTQAGGSQRGHAVFLKGSGDFAEILYNFDPPPPPAPGPSDPLWTFCLKWPAAFIDAGKGEAYLNDPTGFMQVPAAFARVVIQERTTSGSNVIRWRDYLDENGCTGPIAVKPDTSYRIVLGATALKDDKKIEVDYYTDEVLLGGPPLRYIKVPRRPVIIIPWFFTGASGGTASLTATLSDQITKVMAVVSQVMKTPQNGLLPQSVGGAYWIHAKEPWTCAECGQADDEVHLGANVSRSKYVIAHELGHVVQYRGAGNAFPSGPMASEPYPGWVYDWWSTEAGNTSAPACRCDHVTELGAPRPGTPYLGTNRIHCLQAKVGDVGAIVEGFAQFYASRVFNEFNAAATCTFVYYKDSWTETATPVVQPSYKPFNCAASVRWAESKCPTGIAGRASERDEMSFLYSLNVAPASASSMDQIFEIYRFACHPTTGAPCVTNDTWHWKDLQVGAKKALGFPSGQYSYFFVMVVDNGVDN